MNHNYGEAHYMTLLQGDRQAGNADFTLHRTIRGVTKRVARVFYNAECEELHVETFKADIHSGIAQEFFTEAKQKKKPPTMPPQFGLIMCQASTPPLQTQL